VSSLAGSLWTYYVRGGMTMHPMLICSIVGLVIIIERMIVLHRIKSNTPHLFGAIRSALMQGDVQQAIAVCDANPGPVADTLRGGLVRFGKPSAEIEKTLESVALYQLSNLERGLWILASVANIAPLFGFLGTVTGMISAFGALAEVGLGNPKAVAAGISEALITTAYGLFIALPVQAAYNYFTSRIGKIALDMETSSALLLETFNELQDQKPSDSPVDAPVDVSAGHPQVV
jgi:biopolymer transport protein ExbB